MMDRLRVLGAMDPVKVGELVADLIDGVTLGEPPSAVAARAEQLRAYVASFDDDAAGFVVDAIARLREAKPIAQDPNHVP